MSSHICASCRRALSRSLRHRQRPSQPIQHRDLSYTRLERQGATQAANTETGLDHRTVLSDRLTASGYERRTVTNAHPAHPQGVLIGRYSRTPIHPEQLLQQLEPGVGDRQDGIRPAETPGALPISHRDSETGTRAAGTARSERRRERTQHTTHSDGAKQSTYSQRSNPVLEDINRFQRLLRSGKSRLAWQHLSAMAAKFKADQLRVVRQNSEFERQLANVVASEIEAWYLEVIEKDDEHIELQGTVLSGSRNTRIEASQPLAICEVLDELGLLTPGLVALILCNTLYGIVRWEAQAVSSTNSFKIDAALQDVACIWHLMLSKQLRPEMSETISVLQDHYNESLDWRFLPGKEDLQSLKSGPRQSLRRTVELFLPVVVKSAGRADFGSAAVLTVHVLQRSHARSIDAKGRRPDTTHVDHGALKNFWEQVLKAIPDPEMPSFMRSVFISASTEMRDYMSKILPPLRLMPPVVPSTQPAPVVAPLQSEQTTHEPAVRQMQGSLGITDNALSEEQIASANDMPGDASEQLQPQALQGRFTASTERVDQQLKPLVSAQSSTNTEGTATMTPEDIFVAKCAKRIFRALEYHDAAQVDRILSEMLTYEQHNDGKPKLPLSLYEHLISVYMQMRLARRAEQVLDILPKIGLVPDLRIWTTLIRGSSRIGDQNAFDRFWSIMVQSGIRPDAAAYGAKVHALVDLDRPEQAIMTLIEMGDAWLQSQEMPSTASDVPRPTVDVGNAAIAGIVGKQNRDYDKYIPMVLQWIKRFGLEPDTNTFNPLVNNAMKQGNVSEALALLKEMKERGIATNSETGRGLVTGYLKSTALDGLSPEEQTLHLLEVIDDIEVNHIGASLDERAYAIAIDRVLNLYSNKAAADKLLARMQEKGLRPTSHIYTILLDFYMCTSPPDYAAMELLWTDLGAANDGWGAALDDTFFDRALERFSEHHRELGIAKIAEILDHLKKLGKRPSFVALTAVAQCYSQRREMGRLSRLVHELRFTSSLKADTGRRQRFGYKDFWTFIISTGLLDGEGITSYEQVREVDRAAKFGNVRQSM